MIALLIISINLFPDCNAEAVPYLIGAGGAEIGAQITDLCLDDDMPFAGRECLKVFGGLITSACFHYTLRHHFEGNEGAWCQVGRGHFIVFRVGFDTIRHFVKKKPHVAYMETIK